MYAEPYLATSLRASYIVVNDKLCASHRYGRTAEHLEPRRLLADHPIVDANVVVSDRPELLIS